MASCLFPDNQLENQYRQIYQGELPSIDRLIDWAPHRWRPPSALTIKPVKSPTEIVNTPSQLGPRPSPLRCLCPLESGTHLGGDAAAHRFARKEVSGRCYSKTFLSGAESRSIVPLVGSPDPSKEGSNKNVSMPFPLSVTREMKNSPVFGESSILLTNYTYL